MAVKTATLRNALADAYAAAVPYGGLFTSDPGSTGSAAGEVSGGSPAYARKALGWSAAASSATSGSAAFDVPSGTTVSHFGACASNVATTNDVRDSVAIGPQTFSSQGTYTITPTYTQS